MSQPHLSNPIERLRLKKLFRKAEDSELPLSITLNELGFHHWFVERTNSLYLVSGQAETLLGLSFNVNKHVGAQTRKRQCDLCRRFMIVADVISIRSMRRPTNKNVEYQTTYSYICRHLEECRNFVQDRAHVERLIQLHT